MIADRVLPLSGIHNFRDYGGYAVEDGGRLRQGLLWRSAHHEQATDADLGAVDALGLETVIDLRGDDEREMHPCRRSDNFRRASCLRAASPPAWHRIFRRRAARSMSRRHGRE